jgi:hypothetical protein
MKILHDPAMPFSWLASVLVQTTIMTKLLRFASAWDRLMYMSCTEPQEVSEMDVTLLT